MKPRYRALCIAILLVVTAGLCVQYAVADLWDYPGSSDVVERPDAHEGESVFLFATVQEIDGERVTVEWDDHDIDIASVEPETRAGLEPGASIQVDGTVTGPSTVEPDEIVIDYRDVRDLAYVLGTSLLGGLLAAGYFLRHWRLDWRRLRFQPRGES